MTKHATGYLHGFTTGEQDRLIRQARQLEPFIHDQLPFRRARELVEVGCGVGAQTSILLRYFPDLHVTGLDRSAENLRRAESYLATQAWAAGRYQLREGDAATMPFDSASFDAAFVCWILEHVGEPLRVLSETRRVLRPGAPIVCTEVMNASFFVDPYSPHTLDFWRAFNDHQLEIGGDPFVGAKLGNLLQAVGFRDIQTTVKTFHLDNRQPGERAEMLAYWTELLLSAAPGLEAAGKIGERTVRGMADELVQVGRDPNAVFFYSFVQARARAW
ncbi:MAG: methyltransferase domain-containing protein [Planctomycetes bacterium]|nr:methyltransferase domain-containing protein [Planctomycetota bacterium]